ncbi:hypothetical protein OGATHE_001588 [Ogataea polymorpha]|uniref:Uncharacterized protein n=1 Tax=Ogataea polymorpha TaxID=460523 RepID=A0A9P8PN85_9ASCO|nr:hypothetical protein OGATHE_001588 [Ogataea polymorpha]
MLYWNEAGSLMEAVVGSLTLPRPLTLVGSCFFSRLLSPERSFEAMLSARMSHQLAKSTWSRSASEDVRSNDVGLFGRIMPLVIVLDPKSKQSTILTTPTEFAARWPSKTMG